ncbi:hypothetical protein WICMUC_004501 [Wickerhamomyces mucosus]|uniref:Uncharacterized protein n=1 Tax=Wickerhamomyces mucosus TaxID=1378264 RepID=A0A9P8PIJ1_9ASCO|nr:hypothetical protein WICMUC_004501 [Wickerhamomyces mucosus]
MSTFNRYLRASLTQAVIIGFVSFTQPGIWSAIANLGAGGLETTGTANTSIAVLYGIMFVLSPFCSVFINKLGVKPAVTAGTIGYVFWSAGLYLNSKTGAQWLVIFGAVTCAISASFLWVSEAVVALNYSTDGSKGLFVGIWQGINKFGGIISGAIALALNRKTESAGGVSLNTYIALIVVQCLGLPISFLLAKPEQIYRPDGKKHKSNITQDTIVQSLVKWKNALLKKEVLFLLPMITINGWYGTWFGNYTTHNFSVRVRALNSLLTSLICLATDVLMGIFLDLKIKRSFRARASYTLGVILFTVQFIYGFYIEKYLKNNSVGTLDWTDGSDYIKAFVPFQIFKIAGELMFNWVYWIIGSFNFEPSEVVYVSSVVRSFESLGDCFAFVVGTVNTSDLVNLSVSAGLFWLAVPTGFYIAWKVTDEELNTNFITDKDSIEKSEEESEVEKIDIIEKSKTDTDSVV